MAAAISIAGVTTSVSTVAKPSPNTVAVESCTHHCVEGAPTVTSRTIKSMLTPKAIGMTPSTLVMAVRNTGRARWLQVSRTAARAGMPSRLSWS